MRSSRTVTNRPNRRMAALVRRKKKRNSFLITERDRDYSKLPGRGAVIGDTVKLKKFPQGRDKRLCDNIGGRHQNGYKAKEPYEISEPGTAQFRPEVIANNLHGEDYRKPRNTFLVKR